MTRIKNTVILEGFLGEDPKFLTAKSGKPFVSFTIATRNSYKEKESDSWKQKETVWHRNILGFSPVVISQAETFKKGTLVKITGELEYRQTKDADGFNVDVASIIATRIEAVETKASQSETK